MSTCESRAGDVALRALENVHSRRANPAAPRAGTHEAGSRLNRERVTTLRLPFGSISFREKGLGDPLVLLMGTGADHTSWARQFHVLGSRFRVIAPDNRGSGRSEPPPEDGATMKSFAREHLSFLDALGVERFHVAGYSLGAAIAMELAL